MENNNPVTPPVTPDPQTPATPPAETPLTLDDLFGGAPTTPTTPTTPEQPAAPTPPVQTPATPTPTPPVVDPNKIAQQVTDNVSQTINKSIQRQNELTALLNSEKGKQYAPYASEITRVATDPQYINIKLDRVVAMTLGPEKLMQLGAKAAKESETAAAGGGSGGNGGGANPQPAAPVDYGSMSNEEFDKMQAEALQGKFVRKS